jgi:hypothetical protein
MENNLVQIKKELEGKGVRVLSSWIETRLNNLLNSSNNNLNRSEQIYKEFLNSDLNLIGEPVLPPNIEDKHKETLEGRIILQVRGNSLKLILNL